MEARRLRLASPFANLLAALVCSSTSALAQGSAHPTAPPSGERDPFSEMRQQVQRESSLRSVDMMRRRDTESPDPRQVEAAISQIKQDFSRIQILRNDIVHAVAAEKRWDYKLLSEQAKEINKRATRLQQRLVVSSVDSQDAARQDASDLTEDQTRRAVVRLCNTIVSFVENPVMELSGAVSSDQEAKAIRDLQAIVDLSGSVRKNAERLAAGSK